jgi:anti-sigma factor RsiW
MTDCTNETLRDLLPLLAHDALDGDEATALRAHLASCASCVSELRAIEAAAVVFAAATPRVDTAAILAKLPAPPSARPVLKLETTLRTSRSRFGLPRYALAAAASMTLMVTLSLTVLRPMFFGVTPGVGITSVDTGAVQVAVQSAPSAGTEPVSSVGGAELTDLGVDELTQLLNELDQMEATIAAEPRSMREPITTDTEGL